MESLLHTLRNLLSLLLVTIINQPSKLHDIEANLAMYCLIENAGGIEGMMAAKEAEQNPIKH